MQNGVHEPGRMRGFRATICNTASRSAKKRPFPSIWLSGISSDPKPKAYRIMLYCIGFQSHVIALRRIAHRVEIGGHNVPESDMRRRLSSSPARFSNALRYCRSHRHRQRAVS